jgi:hypothetical protein
VVAIRSQGGKGTAVMMIIPRQTPV